MYMCVNVFSYVVTADHHRQGVDDLQFIFMQDRNGVAAVA